MNLATAINNAQRFGVWLWLGECNSYPDLGLNAALGPFAECRSRLSAGPRLRELDFGRNVTFVTLNTKSTKKCQIQQIQLATTGLAIDLPIQLFVLGMEPTETATKPALKKFG